MPQSVHRLLIHGQSSVEQLASLGLTMGEASEEAQETRNKDHKYAREHHTRKISRTKTNEDQMHYMMITSDPLISSLRCPQTEKGGLLPKKALDLLVADSPVNEEEEIDILNDDIVIANEEVINIPEVVFENIDVELPDYYFSNVC